MDHDERWRRIENSLFKDLYLHETKVLLVLGIEAAHRLIELAPRDVGSVLKVHREISIQGGHLISAAGRLQSLLFSAPRAKNESAKRFELRERRAKWLREKVFAGIDVAILDDRAVRNSIEHFDDRLDEIAEKAIDGRFDYPLHVVSDVALGYDGILGFLKEVKTPPKTTQYIRTYVADSQTFHVLRWSFNVAEVLECFEQMSGQLDSQGWVDPRGLYEHTGSILVLAEKPSS